MKTIFFGAGKALPDAIKTATGFDITAIVDNDSQRQGKVICINDIDFVVSDPNRLLETNYDAIVIATTNLQFQSEIISQLYNMRLDDKKIFTINNGLKQIINIKSAPKPRTEERFFYDVSLISKYDFGAGIQRTVNNIYDNLTKIMDVTAVRMLYGKYVTSNEYVCRRTSRPFDNIEYEINLSDKDVILFADPCYDDNVETLNILSQCNAKKIFIIYDILPIVSPHTFEKGGIHKFKKWLDAVLLNATGIIGISKTALNDLLHYYREYIQRDVPLNFYRIDLGYNIPRLDASAAQATKDFVAQGMTFLMVGTIEPRKNHLQALKALKKYYAKTPKVNVYLLIIGREGWLTDSFKDAYFHDDSIQGKVMWLNNADDGELLWAYKNCNALLYPSQNEGYGLPLVEAAYNNLPILCNDIPIFHELLGDNATYFNAGNIDDFADALITWTECDVHPHTKNVQLHTWDETAQQIYSIVTSSTEPYAVF